MRFDSGGTWLPDSTRRPEQALTFDQRVEKAADDLYDKLKVQGRFDEWERMLGEVNEEWKDTRMMTTKARRARRLSLQQDKEQALVDRDPARFKTILVGLLDDPGSSLPEGVVAEDDRRLAVSLIWHRIAEHLMEKGRPVLYKAISDLVNEWYG